MSPSVRAIFVLACAASMLFGAAVSSFVVVARWKAEERPAAAPCPPATVDVDFVCADIAETLEREREIRTTLEDQLYGQPVAWPGDVDPAQVERAFTAVSEQMGVQCGIHPQLPLDCSEPPCILAIRAEEAGERLNQCGVWLNAYGEDYLMKLETVRCEDGSERLLALLADSGGFEQNFDGTLTLAAKKRRQRLDGRWRQLAQGASCAQ